MRWLFHTSTPLRAILTESKNWSNNLKIRSSLWSGQPIVNRAHAWELFKKYKKAAENGGVVAMLQSAVGAAGAINSVQAVACEGDPVEGFAMQVAGKTVRGTFWKTTFTEGDRVQVIGQEDGDVFRD